jgi:primase-polymerase (primpol)-like protein
MRGLDRWVLWTPVSRKDIETKMPLQLTGTAASSTDPLTWTSYTRVRSHRRKGFVLGDGIACLDLDHCIVDGGVVLWARKVLRQTPGCYVEYSPSGEGLHIWGRGHLEPGRKVRFAGGTVEAYSQGRYITVTSRRFGRSPSRLGDLEPFLKVLLS